MYRALLLLAVTGVLASEEPCSCDQVTNDIEDLRKFLSNPQKFSLKSVLPGELSPYICNCNKYRQRRSEIHPKALGDESQDKTKPFFSPAHPKPFFNRRKNCAKRTAQLGQYRCATGYIRKGMFCIPDPCYGDH